MQMVIVRPWEDMVISRSPSSMVRMTSSPASVTTARSPSKVMGAGLSTPSIVMVAVVASTVRSTSPMSRASRPNSMPIRLTLTPFHWPRKALSAVSAAGAASARPARQPAHISRASRIASSFFIVFILSDCRERSAGPPSPLPLHIPVGFCAFSSLPEAFFRRLEVFFPFSFDTEAPHSSIRFCKMCFPVTAKRAGQPLPWSRPSGPEGSLIRCPGNPRPHRIPRSHPPGRYRGTTGFAGCRNRSLRRGWRYPPHPGAGGRPGR